MLGMRRQQTLICGSMRRGVLVATVLLSLSLLPLSAPAAADLEPASGSILAPSSRQAAWLNLEAPRPRQLTSLQAPSYVSDVDVAHTGETAIGVQSPFAGSGPLGGDVFRLDLGNGVMTPLVTREDAGESLVAPMWSADGTTLYVQREDHRQPPTAYQGASSVRYASRIESAAADGSARAVVRDMAWQPAPSPDGRQLAFVRASGEGSALMLATLGTSDDRELVPAGSFLDLGYPRFSPRGDLIAFVVSVPFGAQRLPTDWFTPVAHAHGFPWNVWLVGVDGSNLRMLAEVGADDPSVAWSPDAKQVFVYGGAGSFLVDAQTAELASYPYVQGYGAAAWLP
jgi:Tol biopolymer transport system component